MALMQGVRIATARRLLETQVKTLVDKHIEKPLLGMFGTSKINVLKLYIDLNKIRHPN